MDGIEDILARIELLESRLLMTDLRQQDGEPSAGNAQSAALMDHGAPAETDHEVFWDDELEQWAVRWSVGAFSYAGKSSEPDGLDGKKVPVEAGESDSIYGHALMSIDEHGKVTKVESLAYDTSSEGPSAEEGQVAFDFLVATIEDGVVYQNVLGALHVGGAGVATDDVSLGRLTAEGAKYKDALQIKDFDNDKSDGRQGLVQRIRVVKDGDDSFHLEADGAEVFLVARVKGSLKYIPLTGSKSPDDETAEDPCDHPGDTPGTGKDGGVSPDDEGPHGGGVSVDPAAGVPADGDAHAGEPCPDCSPTGPGVLAE